YDDRITSLHLPVRLDGQTYPPRFGHEPDRLAGMAGEPLPSPVFAAQQAVEQAGAQGGRSGERRKSKHDEARLRRGGRPLQKVSGPKFNGFGASAGPLMKTPQKRRDAPLECPVRNGAGMAGGAA